MIRYTRPLPLPDPWGLPSPTNVTPTQMRPSLLYIFRNLGFRTVSESSWMIPGVMNFLSLYIARLTKTLMRKLAATLAFKLNFWWRGSMPSTQFANGVSASDPLTENTVIQNSRMLSFQGSFGYKKYTQVNRVPVIAMYTLSSGWQRIPCTTQTTTNFLDFGCMGY